MSLIQRLRDWIDNLTSPSHNYRLERDEHGVERHHDPYWYLDDEDSDDWEDGAEPLQQGRLHNRTDYDLPQGWGSMSEEERDQWFLTRRVWRQINRQYDEGMWDQWDIETLRAGLMPRETAEELHENENEYRYDDD